VAKRLQLTKVFASFFQKEALAFSTLRLRFLFCFLGFPSLCPFQVYAD
jgi:hypothetical protein